MVFPIFDISFLNKMTIHTFNLFLIIMASIALVVYVSLFFVDAGYGKFYNPKWGPSVNNKLGWVEVSHPIPHSDITALIF